MADRNAIARVTLERAAALKTQQAAAGGYGSFSPLVQSYQGWNFGQTGAPSNLPRGFLEFLSGAFGPMLPPNPAAIDHPEQSGRPLPRRTEYLVGYDLATGTPGSEGLKLASFATLRRLADVHSVTRACINIRTSEIIGLDWDIQPTPDAAEAMKGNDAATKEFEDRKRQAVQFFKRPDYNYPNYQAWLSALLEELFVIDAVAIYPHQSRVKGKGLLGSNLASLDLLDGATIKPLLNIRGETPQPPNVAYQAYEFGYPRVDLLNPFTGREADMLGDDFEQSIVDEYAGDQLIYLRYNTRTFTPYGFSPVEQALVPALTQMRKQQYRLDFFAEGSLPGMYIVGGESMTTPQQTRQWQEVLNAMAGDPAYKHKHTVLPAGSHPFPQKPIELAGPDDEFLYGEICMSWNIQPMELGIMPKASTTGGGATTGAANQMAKASETQSMRKGLGPLLQFLADAVFTYTLQQICGQMDMQWKWTGLDSEESEQAKAQRLQIEIGCGLRSIDEGRTEIGLDPWGDEMTGTPLWASPTGGIQALAGMTIEEASQPPAALPFGQPAEQPPAAGGDPTPHDAAAATPEEAQQGEEMPALKAMLAEVDKLRRFVKKGRSVESFRVEAIPSRWLDRAVALAAAYPAVSTVSHLRKIVKADSKRKRRDRTLAPVVAALTGGIVAAAKSSDFTAKSSDAMKTALTDALALGSAAAAKDVGAEALDKGGVIFTEILGDRFGKQRSYLIPFGKQLGGLTDDEIEARAALYGDAVVGAYENGYGATASQLPGMEGTWVAEDDACPECADLDGETFTAEELTDGPGWPGDNHPNCRCSIDWAETSVAAAATAEMTKFQAWRDWGWEGA